MTTIKTLSTPAYREGFAARMADKNLASNPYGRTVTGDMRDWLSGWLDADTMLANAS